MHQSIMSSNFWRDTLQAAGWDFPMSENLGIKMFGRCLVALRRVWTIHTRQPDDEDAEFVQKLANRAQATGADMSPWG